MTLTIKQRKAKFEADGISIRDWAHRHSFNPRTVYAVVNGQIKGKRGISHRIAIELGLKVRPRSEDVA